MEYARVDLPDEFVFEELEDNLVNNRAMFEKILEKRITAPDYSFTLLAARALESLGLLILKGEAGSDEASKWLGVAVYAECYSLELANYPEGSKEIEILIPPRRESFFRTSMGPNSTANTSHWLQAFYLTLIWWEPSLLDQILMNVTYETLKASSTQSPAYRYLEIEAAKALYQQRPDASVKIMEAMDSMENVLDIDKEFVAYVAMHECGMMAMLALNDEEGFNKEVALALESHVKFWRGGETRRNAPEAWFCLPALGLSALAIRRGMKVHVKSPYLPLELLAP